MTCYCDTEIPELCQADWHRAARKHRCVDCGRAIQRGEQYLEYRVLYEGQWSRHRACRHCDSVRAALVQRLPCYCYLIGGLYEDEGLPDHIADLRAAGTGDAFAVLRLIAAGRRALREDPRRTLHLWPRHGKTEPRMDA